MSRVLRAILAAVLCATASGAPAPDDRPATVDFTFDDVDISSLVKLVGEVTGKRFVIDAGVEGKVTVVAPAVPLPDVERLLGTVLESAGCGIVQEGELYRVVSLGDRRPAAGRVAGPREPLVGPGMVTRVIRLRYAQAAEVAKMLDALLAGRKGAVAALETTNHLIVSDTPANIRRAEQLIAEVDLPGLARSAEVVTLRHAGAEDLAAQLNAVLARPDSAADQLRRRLPQPPGAAAAQGSEAGVVAVASPNANSLILVGPQAGIEEARRILDLLDVESPLGKGRLHAVFLKYISAEQAATSLKALLGTGVTGDGKSSPAQAQERKVAIEASAANNALLVDASPTDFEMVRTLIADLDQPIGQVLTEVIIAEVSLSDESDIGVTLAAVDMPSGVGDTVVQGSSAIGTDAGALLDNIEQGLLPAGLTVRLAHGTRLDAAGNLSLGYPGIGNINALKKKGRVKILSSIPLVGQNNTEASVSVVNNIPVLKSTIQGGTGSARDVIQNIDRIDVGVKLKLTPHINPDRKVKMLLNPSIEAVIDPGPDGSGYTPTIARREVSTTVTVGDGETIAITGLIREDETRVVRKVPLLGDIPLLGWLFRRTVEAKERTNLLIFVTPHVIGEGRSAEVVTRAMERHAGISATNRLEIESAPVPAAP